MMEKKLGLFTESDLININTEVKAEQSIDVAVTIGGCILPLGAAVAAGGFAAAGV